MKLRGLTLWQRLQRCIVRRVNRYYRERVQPRLFAMSQANAEVAHEWALSRLAWVNCSRLLRFLISIIGVVRDPRLTQIVCGLRWRTPVGMAAGFDKYARVFAALESLGFCGIELGGFTRYGQSGKDQPRMFRLPKDKAVINRMGFNNPGAIVAARDIVVAPKVTVPLGINLGKSLQTPFEDAAMDYAHSVVILYESGDYFVVNVSSPNTADLRRLQDKKYLRALLQEVKEKVRISAAGSGLPPKPIFVKISPDLSNAEIDDIIAICLEFNVGDIKIGIIAANTTVGRAGLTVDIHEEGGLSGPPLRERALEIVRYIRARVPDDFVIIGVGGISSARDVYNMLKAGANLVQLYTAFVYEGPFIVTEINLDLLELMAEDQVSHVSELRRAA